MPISRVDVFHLEDKPDGSLNVEKTYYIDTADRALREWLTRTISWAVNNERGVTIEPYLDTDEPVELFVPKNNPKPKDDRRAYSAPGR